MSTVVNMVFQIGFMAVMARLLDPAAFGLMALALVTVRVANYFAQLGIGPAVVQKPTLDDVDIRVAFTLSAALGFVAAGVVYAAAPLVGRWLENAQLVGVIQVLTLSFVLAGMSSVSQYLLRRQLRFKAIAFIESVSYIFGYGTCGVVLALNGAGVWSLVGAVLCQNLLTVLLGYVYTRHPVLPVFDRRAIRHFYDFGTRYSVIGFLEFIGSNLDTLVIGKVLGNIATGIYSRAFLLTNLPVQQIVTTLTKVMFPILSEAQHDRHKVGQAYLVLLFLVGSLTGATCFGMIPAADDLVRTVLGNKWGEAIPVLKVLAIAVPFVFLSHICGVTLDAMGMLRPKLVIQSASIIVLAVVMYLFSHFGLVGFAAAVVVTEVLKSLAYYLVMASLFGLSSSAVARIVMYIVVISGVTTTAIWLAANLAARVGLPNWSALLIEIVVGGGCLFLLFLKAWARLGHLPMYRRWARLGHLPMYRRLNERFPLLVRLSARFRFREA